MMTTIFNDNLNSFLELFVTIESADPEVDYDRFCKINVQQSGTKSVQRRANQGPW